MRKVKFNLLQTLQAGWATGAEIGISNPVWEYDRWDENHKLYEAAVDLDIIGSMVSEGEVRRGHHVTMHEKYGHLEGITVTKGK